MKTGKIVCFTMIILLFCAAAWPTGCGTAAGSESKEGMPKTASEANGPVAPVSRDEEPAETAPEDTVIHFLDPVIEAETRRILNKPAGDIMKKEVLGITDFGVDREYEDYGSLGKIGSVSGEIATLKDLQWFKNLKVLILSDCDLDSLEGIEELTELRVLYVRRNRLRDIEPVRNLEHLAYFDCAYNNIDDYSALCSLTEMKELGIGDNGMAYTDLSPLENMTRLSALYAPFCGIDDISVLKNMPDLEYLQLFHNDISDISALANLEKLDYLELLYLPSRTLLYIVSFTLKVNEKSLSLPLDLKFLIVNKSPSASTRASSLMLSPSNSFSLIVQLYLIRVSFIISTVSISLRQSSLCNSCCPASSSNTSPLLFTPPDPKAICFIGGKSILPALASNIFFLAAMVVIAFPAIINYLPAAIINFLLLF